MGEDELGTEKDYKTDETVEYYDPYPDHTATQQSQPRYAASKIAARQQDYVAPSKGKKEEEQVQQVEEKRKGEGEEEEGTAKNEKEEEDREEEGEEEEEEEDEKQAAEGFKLSLIFI